ncbi:unnamed protein product [Brassicogethes aeneus]|uniref:RRM domain-containing protein n=1 Tax=Brassicogethes aeneus TaxID=1431903 RepID=A0A9P0AMY9_BRAAE|nr:unnamed protein product [Brassicogethes aeneus]
MSEEYFVEKIPYQVVLFSKAKTRKEFPEDHSELYVRDVPTDATVWELFQFFQIAGRIYEIRLMMNADYESNRQFAYVSFFTKDEAANAIQRLNDEMFRKNEGCLDIKLSFNNRRIFLGNIATQKSKDQVWKELERLGNKNIIDVIMYRSYGNRTVNRGFVFVEFKTHEQAARFRAKNSTGLQLFGREAIVDWSIPYPEPNDEIMQKVNKIFLRNLNVLQTNEELKSLVSNFISCDVIEKVYKFKDYAFVHCTSREIAECLYRQLQEYYKNTPVEVSWAKPPNEYTTAEYRQKKVNQNEKMKPYKSATSRSSSDEEASTSRLGDSPNNFQIPPDNVAFYQYVFGNISPQFFKPEETKGERRFSGKFSPEMRVPLFSQVVRGRPSNATRVPFQELNVDVQRGNTASNVVKPANVCQQLFDENKENEFIRHFEALKAQDENQDQCNFEESRFMRHYRQETENLYKNF